MYLSGAPKTFFIVSWFLPIKTNQVLLFIWFLIFDSDEDPSLPSRHCAGFDSGYCFSSQEWIKGWMLRTSTVLMVFALKYEENGPLLQRVWGNLWIQDSRVHLFKSTHLKSWGPIAPRAQPWIWHRRLTQAENSTSSKVFSNSTVQSHIHVLHGPLVIEDERLLTYCQKGFLNITLNLRLLINISKPATSRQQ